MWDVQESTPAVAAPLQCRIAPAAPCLLLPVCTPAEKTALEQLPSKSSPVDSTLAGASSIMSCCAKSSTHHPVSSRDEGTAGDSAAECLSLGAWIWAPCGAELQGWKSPSASSSDIASSERDGSSSKPPVLRVLACTDVAYLPTQVYTRLKCGDSEGQELLEVG